MFYTLFELSILNKRIEWIQSRRKIFTIISRRMMAYLLCNLIIIITSPSWTISLSMNSIPNIISTYFNFYISLSISVQICQFKVRFCLDSQRTVVQIRKKIFILFVDSFWLRENFSFIFTNPILELPFAILCFDFWESAFILLRLYYTAIHPLVICQNKLGYCISNVIAYQKKKKVMSPKMLVNLLVKSLDNWYGTYLLFHFFPFFRDWGIEGWAMILTYLFQYIIYIALFTL